MNQAAFTTPPRGAARSRARAGGHVAHLVVFLVLLALITFLGGSSRADQSGLLLLRPAALVVATFAGLVMTREQWETVKGPTVILGALAGLIALQLVPLPPSLWSLLPGRDEYMETYAALGLDVPWLPISQSPVRTWNSLVCLVVPFATVLSYGLLQPHHRKLVLPLVIAIGLASALLGVLQVLSGGSRSLYFYSIANFGSNTGFFANRNHQAIFLAALLVLVPVARRSLERDRVPPYALNLIAIGTIALLAFAIATTGSRIGFVVGTLATIWATWKIYLIVDAPTKTKFRRARGSFNLSIRVQRLLIPSGMLLLALAVVISPRSVGLDRMTSESTEAAIEDLRVDIFKNSLEMIPENMPFGGGAGTFADVYKGYEDARNISYRYVNHAHNDILELIYEFGLVGLLLAIGALLLITRWAWAAMRVGRTHADQTRAAALALLVVLIGSVFDYPARTPIVASFVMLALAWIYEAYRIPPSHAEPAAVPKNQEARTPALDAQR